MRRPQRRQRPRAAQLYSYPAPRDGWIANQNLAQPNAKKPDGTLVSGAQVLDNMFPTAQGVVLMRGSRTYATLGSGGQPVRSLFSYNVGQVRQLFGATDDTIYNITTVAEPFNVILATEDDDLLATEVPGEVLGWESTEGLDVATDYTGGYWVVVQFATPGGVYLVGVNGEDESFIYDGSTFYPQVSGGLYRLDYDGGTAPFTDGSTITGGTSGATAIIERIIPDDPDAPEVSGTLWLSAVAGGPFDDDEQITDADGGDAFANGAGAIIPGTDVTFKDDTTGLTTADLSYVWAYQSRLFYVQKNTLNAWYASVNSIAGELTQFPMGAIFQLGGSLLFGLTWSLDAGEQGGLSEQCIFVTTEGEVAVYQGSNPADINDWRKVGVYRIGRPLGPKAWVRDGGDIIIATSIGWVRLSAAIKYELAALGPTSVSYPIEVAWNEAVERRPGSWDCEIWPTKQMAMIALPTPDAGSAAMFVANVRTGAWGRVPVRWNGTCLHVFNERMFFGTPDGRVVEADITGSDDGQPYTGVCVPMFHDLETPASLKVVELIKAFGLAPVPVEVQMSMQTNYYVSLPAPPPAQAVAVGSQWDNALWGQATWDAELVKLPREMWVTASGDGTALAPSLQVTSGAVAPLDYELIRIDMMYRVAEVVT